MSEWKREKRKELRLVIPEVKIDGEKVFEVGMVVY